MIAIGHVCHGLDRFKWHEKRNCGHRWWGVTHGGCKVCQMGQKAKRWKNRQNGQKVMKKRIDKSPISFFKPVPLFCTQKIVAKKSFKQLPLGVHKSAKSHLSNIGLYMVCKHNDRRHGAIINLVNTFTDHIEAIIRQMAFCTFEHS